MNLPSRSTSPSPLDGRPACWPADFSATTMVTPADALRAYNNIRSAMLDQLGMEPGTALQKLQRTVLCREGIRGRALGNRNAPVS